MLRKLTQYGLAALLLFAHGLAQAAFLTPGIQLDVQPDISASGGLIFYDAGTDAFTYDAIATEITVTNNMTGGDCIQNGALEDCPIVGGGISISATIDASGNLAAGGTFSITGTVADLGFMSGTLLTGTLTALGWGELVTDSDELQFLATVTGGDAAGIFGSQVFSIISGDTGFTPGPGAWSSSFDNEQFFPGSGIGLAQSDSTPPLILPAPAAIWLLGAGLLLLSRRQRSLARSPK